MPELPEVEIVKNDLTNSIVNKIINKVFIGKHKLRKYIPDLEPIVNHKILEVKRENKYILINTEEYSLVIHLGMTGALLLNENKEIKHTHLVITFNDGTNIKYIDPRRFGMIDLISVNNVTLYKDLSCDLTKGQTLSTFKLKAFNKNRSIKSLLLDGKILSGVGNIYACESLFLSKINPNTLGKNISISKLKELCKSIKEIFIKAISLGGSSINDYKHIDGTKGLMQEHYYVYGREGLNCFNCQTKILRIKQNGRSSYYCPKCQRG